MKTDFILISLCAGLLGSVSLVSCHQQQQQILYALETATPVPEDTPVTLNCAYVVYHLQILPNGEGVKATNYFHPMAPREYQKKYAGLIGTFVVKNDAYGIETQLKKLMKQGTRPSDRENNVDGEIPYISFGGINMPYYRYGGDYAEERNELMELNSAVMQANEDILGKKKESTKSPH